MSSLHSLRRVTGHAIRPGAFWEQLHLPCERVEGHNACTGHRRDLPGHQSQDLALPNTLTAIVPAIEPTPNPATPNQVASNNNGCRNPTDGRVMQPGHRTSADTRIVGCSFSSMKSSLASPRSILCVDCYRTLRSGLIERKIASYSSDPVSWILDAFMDPSIRVAHRDTAPIRYWIVMGLQIIALVALRRCCDIWVVAPKQLSTGCWHLANIANWFSCTFCQASQAERNKTNVVRLAPLLRAHRAAESAKLRFFLPFSPCGRGNRKPRWNSQKKPAMHVPLSPRISA